MCDHHDHAPAMPGRREALRAGAALAAAPLLASLPTAAFAAESHAAVGARPFATRA